MKSQGRGSAVKWWRDLKKNLGTREQRREGDGTQEEQRVEVTRKPTWLRVRSERQLKLQEGKEQSSDS